MKKLLCCFLILVVLFVLLSCQSKAEAEYHVTGFDGDKLYIECDGNTVVYERHKPGVGSFTKKTMLDLFIVLSAEFLRNRLVLENLGLFMVEKDYFV